MANTWNEKRATAHIDQKIASVKKVEVLEYTRERKLETIPISKSYRVHGVHLYVDILNFADMLNGTEVEGVICHQRTMRFLNLHYRAVDRILNQTNARRVDFHNQRLHGLVAKPYGTEENKQAERVQRSVAIAQLVIDVLSETGDENIPDAKVRVGICSGQTLAVNNGRNGDREPLFLGGPANHAAKMAGGGAAKGIFLTNAARAIIGLEEVDVPKTRALTKAEIEQCQEQAALDVTKDAIVEAWKKDLEKNPIGAFEFYRSTPPLKDMKIEGLTPGNSRRQEAVSMYADLTGFTAFVDKHIDDNPEDVVRVLHVVRAELARAFQTEFGGRRIRFIGDCVHGLICEGTSQNTDDKETISVATLCAGALRSSFDLAIEKLKNEGIDVDGLGLSIGFEHGPVAITRLGLHGNRVRCSIGRGVLKAEERQQVCSEIETGIGSVAYSAATRSVQELFGSTRKVANLDYNEALAELSDGGDETAKAAKDEALSVMSAPAVVANETTVRPYASSL